MTRKIAAHKTETVKCDYCAGKLGHNKQIVHILSRQDRQTLIDHLNEVFPKVPYCVDFFTALWDTAHTLYFKVAKERNQPLWLIYLEANGVKITNRADAIYHHRNKHGGHPLDR